MPCRPFIREFIFTQVFVCEINNVAHKMFIIVEIVKHFLFTDCVVLINCVVLCIVCVDCVDVLIVCV